MLRGTTFFERAFQAVSIAYDSDLAAYVVPAVYVAGLSSTSFLISAVRQWRLLREQEALLAEEWAAREEEVVGDSPEVRCLFPGRVAVQRGKVRSRCRGPSAVRAYYSSFRCFPLERLAMARESLAPVRMPLGNHLNAIRARGILRTAQARQAIRRTRRAAATHGDDRDPYGGTLAFCVAQFLYRIGFIDVMIIQHPSSLYLSRARLKWSKGSIDFQSIASLSFAAARSAHVYCMSQKSLPFPPGFAVIRFQLDAAGEGRPHRWYAADGSDGVSLEYGPAAFSFS